VFSVGDQVVSALGEDSSSLHKTSGIKLMLNVALIECSYDGLSKAPLSAATKFLS
jgi:hypothetical protein